jgi:O-antigen ligase
MRFSPESALKLVAWACCIAAAASLVLVVVDPRVAVHQAGDIHEGAWRGIFGHKNNMGRSMAFAVVTLAATAFIVGTAARLAALAGALVCGALLAMSLSRTGWVVALFVVMAVPLFLVLQPNRFSRGIRIFAAGLGAIIALTLIALGYKYGLALMGRDDTLSGRTRLWELAINSGMKHFALGAGYRAYWTEAGSMDVAAETSIGGGSLGNGHNGYLDTWLEIGLLGFAAFLLVLATAARRIMRRLTVSPDPVIIWLAMILSYMAIYAWTEQILIQQSEITWVMLVATLFWLTPERRKVRRSGRRAVEADASRASAARPRIVLAGDASVVRWLR